MAQQDGPRWADQHDTAILAPVAGPVAGQYGPAPAQYPYGMPVDATAGRSPEAAYWEAKYRRSRMWLRLLGSLVAVGFAAALLGGLFVWKVVAPRVSDVIGGTSSVTDLLGGGEVPGVPDGGLGSLGGEDLSALAGALQQMGTMLGIDNLDDLITTGVEMGLVTQEQADQLREALRNGGTLDDLDAQPGSGGLSS